MKRPLLVWLAILLPLWVLLILGTTWEPIMRDGWGHWLWHRNIHLSLEHLYEFAKGTYVHNNPRIGQVLTLLVFTPGPWHSIVTPLVELGVFAMLTALVLGRWPSWRRTDDALLFLTIVAIVFACARSIGPMLFYRPFTGNYVFGLALNLLWLLPYRFHAGEPRRHGLVWVPLMLALGFVSGLANEHTGPALVAAGLFSLYVYARRGEWFVPWAIAGILGNIAGIVALLLAPGQDFRYNGLAVQQSTLGRIVERGVHGNGKILFVLVFYMLPVVLWLVLGIVGKLRRTGEGQPRERSVAELAGVGVTLLIVLTLLASPKQGDRLYFAPVCLLGAAIAGWVLAQLGRVERIVAAVGAAAVVAYVSIRLIIAYHTAHAEFTARMATIQAAAPGSTVTVLEYSQKRSRWVLGDDFQTPGIRANIAAVYGLAGVDLTQRDETTPPPADDP